MILALIVAASRDGVIGRGGALPWHLSRDLKRFRHLTWGKPIIMGRRTLESIGRPLPGRCNIALTRQTDYQAEGVRLARDPDEALALAAEEAERSGEKEGYVIGGRQVYAALLGRCDRALVTIVEGSFEGDTHFPGDLPAPPVWRLLGEESYPPDEKNTHAHRFQVLERIRG